MKPYTIYVVDDEESIREGIHALFSERYHVLPFETAEEALAEMAGGNSADLVLMDIGLPGMQGIEALQKIKAAYSETPVIMITAFEDLQTIVSAMKKGAFDYIVKPVNPDHLDITLRNALETVKLRREVRELQDRLLIDELPFFVAESDAIQNVLETVSRVAKSSDTPVLILGETGTGKELIASAIHYRSPHFRGPFITVNCASIPVTLLESELFGYEKGAFTGAAHSGKKGLIEEARDGTLFLDEAGDLSLEAQAKLLRFLESGEFYRVGGTKKHTVITRVISATNRDIEELIKNRCFRKDLYYRLGVVKIQIPSLNERKADITPLAKHFLLHFTRKFGKSFKAFSYRAESSLVQHHWSGNIRELRNIIERAVLVGEGELIHVKDLSLESEPVFDSPDTTHMDVSFSHEGIKLDETLDVIEKKYIQQALEISGGNESEAARLLGLNHHTFRYRRKKHLS